MAHMLVPYEGDSDTIENLRGRWNGDINLCQLGLYTDPGYTFSYSDVLADLLAIEAGFDGYTRFGLGSWAAATGPDGSGRMTSVETLRTFICTGLTGLPVTIYGYFVFNDVDNRLMWVQAAAVGVVIATVGDFYAVIPRYTQRSEF